MILGVGLRESCLIGGGGSAAKSSNFHAKGKRFLLVCSAWEEGFYGKLEIGSSDFHTVLRLGHTMEGSDWLPPFAAQNAVFCKLYANFLLQWIQF